MFQIIRKYISISLIALFLFFTNSGFLHAFSSLHENTNESSIVEHYHNGQEEIHVENILEPTEDSHCINLHIDTIPHSLSERLISGGKTLCTTIDFFAIAQIEWPPLDESTYKAYYPWSPQESFGHFLIGEQILIL